MHADDAMNIIDDKLIQKHSAALLLAALSNSIISLPHSTLSLRRREKEPLSSPLSHKKLPIDFWFRILSEIVDSSQW